MHDVKPSFLTDTSQRALAYASRSLLSAPEFFFQRFSKQRPDYGRLDPKLAALCYFNELGPRLETQPLPTFRKRFSLLQHSLSQKLTTKTKVLRRVISCSDGASLDLWIYQPSNPSPLSLLYLHGGGFVLGDPYAYQPMMMRMATALDQTIIFVHYRLAPEHPYPGPLSDCWDAYQWLRSDEAISLGIDANHIALAGDSAGANLCLGICQKLIARQAPLPQYQVLIYPWLDLRLTQASLRDYQSGFLLSSSMLHWFRDQYLPSNASYADPLVSPLLSDLHRYLPSTLIYAAEMDPLVDEAASFAVKLRRAGVDVEYHKFERLVHGFLGFSGVIPAADQAFEKILAALKRQNNLALHTGKQGNHAH